MLSRASQTTKGYDLTRIISISHTEIPDSYKADIILRNSDKALVGLDFEDYQVVISNGYHTNIARSAWAAGTAYAIDDIRCPVTANGYQYRCAVAGTSHAAAEPTWPTALGVRVTDNTVTWEMDGNTGDEYDRTAPLKARVQEFHSGRGVLRYILRAIGIPDQMKEEGAIAEYTQLSTNTNTVKTLISAVCAASTGLSSAFNGYPVITVVYDSEDSLLDVFSPAEYFSISMRENRWDKLQELLAYTKCKARIGNDGKLHILVPVVSGTTYAYEYKWNVAGDHSFFSKTVRLRFVEPNKIIVSSDPTHSPVYTGSATSATSYALDPKIYQAPYRRLVSNAQATSIAEAMVEQKELNAEKGIASVPMNVGQELWDYVKVTDSRQGDTRIGNIQYLQRETVIPPMAETLTWGPGLTFRMTLSFGAVSALSLMSLLLAPGSAGTASYTKELLDMIFDAFMDALVKLEARINALGEPGEPGEPFEIPDPLLINTIKIMQQIQWIGGSGVVALIRKLDSPAVWLFSPDTEEICLDLDADKSIYPIADKTGQLGKSTHTWQKGYIDKLYAATRAVAPVGADKYD